MTVLQRKLMRQEGYVVVAEAAAASGVPPSTIYRMVGDGRVEARKAVNTTYVSVRSLAQHYEELLPIYKRIMALLKAHPLKKHPRKPK